MRYSLRTLLIVLALAPAIVWAITVGLATYLEWTVSEYKPATEVGKDAPLRAVKGPKRPAP
jgi:hypothetical protein